MPLTPSQRRKLLARKVNQAMKDLRRLDKSSVKNILGTLRRTRIDISETLKGVERFEMPYLRAIRDEIDTHITGFQERMTGTVNSSQQISFDSGANLSDDILKTAEISFGTPMLSEDLIIAAQSSSADLILDMADEMKRDVNRSLRRSILAGDNTFQAARGIDKIIGVNKRKGYMNRSDVIARTEIGRTFSIARQAKDEDIAKQVPEMRKQWINAQDTRVRNKDMGGGRGFVSHRNVHGQIRKVDEPFDLGGGVKAMYPRDISLPPEHSVNCRCQSIPYMEGWE